MDRHRPGLTPRTALLVPALLAVLIGGVAGCTAAPSDSGSTVTTDSVPTSTTDPGPTGRGYPLAPGRRVDIAQGQTGTVSIAIGDVLAVHRPTIGTRPSGGTLVLAEVTDTQLIYQAITSGTVTLASDDPPTSRPCSSTPCPPGRPAPPVMTVTINP